MQSTPSSLEEWFFTMDSGHQFPLLIVALILGIFALVFVTAIVAGTLYRIHKNRLEDALKRELLERGMSAEEIATVVQAKPGSRMPQLKPLQPLGKG